MRHFLWHITCWTYLSALYFIEIYENGEWHCQGDRHSFRSSQSFTYDLNHQHYYTSPANSWNCSFVPECKNIHFMFIRWYSENFSLFARESIETLTNFSCSKNWKTNIADHQHLLCFAFHWGWLLMSRCFDDVFQVHKNTGLACHVASKHRGILPLSRSFEEMF